MDLKVFTEWPSSNKIYNLFPICNYGGPCKTPAPKSRSTDVRRQREHRISKQNWFSSSAVSHRTAITRKRNDPLTLDELLLLFQYSKQTPKRHPKQYRVYPDGPCTVWRRSSDIISILAMAIISINLRNASRNVFPWLVEAPCQWHIPY